MPSTLTHIPIALSLLIVLSLCPSTGKSIQSEKKHNSRIRHRNLVIHLFLFKDPDSDLLAQSSDLDQPECEQQQQQHHNSHPSTMEEIVTTTNGSGNGLMSSSDGGSEFYIQITVSEPQKVGDGMGSYLAYRVTTTTNMGTFKKRDFYVLRRFSDFLGLHEILVRDYLRYGRIIPPAPQKNIIGTTKVKMGNATGNQQSPTDSMTASTIAGGGAGGGLEWVENRRAALERFLNRTAQHPVLRQDVSFVNFLESEQELPRAVNTSTLSGAGVLRMFNKVSGERSIDIGSKSGIYV